MENENKFEKLEPIRVKALDDILGIPFKVLDDGFVRVVDYLGSDQSIVQAARVSYGKGTKQISQDRGLIRYLLRHRHTTPFEMCEIKLHIRIPMDAWRQWIRHRTANVNEYSTRYSLAIESAQTTNPDQWRMQSTDNKQGSSGFFDSEIGSEMTADEKFIHDKTREIYNKRVAQGVAREQARKDLPLSTYTEAYWKIDLHNLLHFLELRMEKNAQLEIREYASTIGNEIVKRWAPIAWEAFEEYALNSKEFSRFELELLSLLANGKFEEAKSSAINYGWLNYKNDELTFNMERWEFENKMNDLKIQIPW
ncbi:MAG: FAD-dependent thymidylate synthase [Bacteroidetes bacterium]|nr:FAD-dependent thymidylate synthase [Bacteroidota bacterium]MBU1113892.1 FAD-dependent thymidylate synthase [Bacteroidota bacterium]MBU1798082.1 FAD-dependent thymidylate synthase [Bacteroidota bacterium]